MTAPTTQDCVQVYSAAILNDSLTGKSGRSYWIMRDSALSARDARGRCTRVLGDIILRPGKRYDHTTIYRFVAMA